MEDEKMASVNLQYSKKAFGFFIIALLLVSSFLVINQNADGTRVTFYSDANIGGGNPEGNIEIYLFDTTTGIITQITDTGGVNDGNT